MRRTLADLVVSGKITSTRQGNTALEVPSLNPHAEIIGNLPVSRHLRTWRHPKIISNQLPALPAVYCSLALARAVYLHIPWVCGPAACDTPPVLLPDPPREVTVSRFSALAAMKIVFPQWAIRVNESLRVYTAERREGSAIRFIVASDLDSLADKLTEANER